MQMLSIHGARRTAILREVWTQSVERETRQLADDTAGGKQKTVRCFVPVGVFININPKSTSTHTPRADSGVRTRVRSRVSGGAAHVRKDSPSGSAFTVHTGSERKNQSCITWHDFKTNAQSHTRIEEHVASHMRRCVFKCSIVPV